MSVLSAYMYVHHVCMPSLVLTEVRRGLQLVVSYQVDGGVEEP